LIAGCRRGAQGSLVTSVSENVASTLMMPFCFAARPLHLQRAAWAPADTSSGFAELLIKA
jgi:hypothetical protein